MDRKLDDDWTWVIETITGGRLSEETVDSIHAVPTQIVAKIGLIHPRARVMVEVLTGVTEVKGAFGMFTVRPQHPAIAVVPKVPLFFRRKQVKTDEAGITTLFRVVGFVALDEGGAPAQICGLRIFDDRIETHYHTQWPPSTARHTTGQAMILGT